MIKAAVILIYNELGELALQLRSAEDDSYPLHWDFSAGGGIDHGERPEEAAQREVREELGISTELEQIDEFHYGDVRVVVPTYTYSNASDNDATAVFRAQYSGGFMPDPKEVERVQCANQMTLKIMIARNEKFHPELFYYLTKKLLK